MTCTILSRRSLVIVTALAAWAAAGCSRKPPVTAVTDQGGGPKVAPQEHFQAAMKSLGKSATAGFESQMDSVHSREAVDHLNRYLKSLAKKPALRLSRKDRDRLRAEAHLDPGELAEVGSPQFTPLDAHYLESCYQLAQVVSSLELKGLPPLERARKGFAWVVRQVNLVERLFADGLTAQDDDILPPQTVLQLGYGTARERAVLFLALLQQMGLDGCMVAVPPPPGKAGRGKGYTYWVPGVLISTKNKGLRDDKVPPGIYLFDTRLGITLPGPGGKGIARLAEVIKDPKQLNARFEDTAPQAVVPEGVERAEVALACPLSGLAPRMKFLQSQLTSDRMVVLAVDPVRLGRRFGQVTRRPVRVWNQPKDRNTPTRVFRANYPTRSGGVDETNRLARVRGTKLMPWPLIKSRFPSECPPQVQDWFHPGTFRNFKEFCLKARSAMLHGQFPEAAKALQSAQDYLRKLRGFYLEENDGDQREKQFRLEIKAFAAKLAGALKEENDAKARLGNDPNDAEAQQEAKDAQNKVKSLVKDNVRLVGLISYMATGEALGRESTYLLCLCTQEKAERFQARRERVEAGRRALRAALDRARDRAKQAWGNAADGWARTYSASYALNEESFAVRLDPIEELGRQGKKDRATAAFALALHDSLVQDVVRTISAWLFQARALELEGRRPEALDLLRKQAGQIKQWAKGGLLKRLRRVRVTQLAVAGVASYAGPDTIDWARASLAYHIDRLKK
jgi:hypothetical protein